MISIVVIDDEHSVECINNIKKNCGLRDVEIISLLKKGENIGKIYNQAIHTSSNDIVVFYNKNIKIHTKNWGKKIINHFKENKYSILGVSGSLNIPLNWLWWKDKSTMIGNISSIYDDSHPSFFCGNFQDRIIQSAVVDLNLFVLNKNNSIKPFNENITNDSIVISEFCLNNYEKRNIGVFFDIKIEQTTQQFPTGEVTSSKIPFKIKPKIVLPITNKNIKNEPKIAIIIPTKGNIELLIKCVNSIGDKDEYKNRIIYIADTGSTDEEKDLIRQLIEDNDRSIRLIEYDYYNFARINNDVVSNHVDEDTDLLLFCNNDIELVNNAITRMVEVYIKNKHTIGTIGGRLHYPDNTIQCGGIFCKVGKDQKLIIHHYGFKSSYGFKPHNINVFANTGAFLLINKNLFHNIGGFNEKYTQCYEDVELSLTALINKKTNIVVNDAVCYHKEGISRDIDHPDVAKEYKDILYTFMDKNINKLRKHIIFT
tara:strand:- start:91 stop:1539 length:1449 start_codon:yes stop_codon:yes gene_type:complete